MSNNHRVLVKECIEHIESDNKLNLLCEVFYEKLFLLEPKLKILLTNNKSDLNRKFFSMISTFKGVKHLNKISEAIISMGERHKSYGMTEYFLSVMNKALIESLSSVMNDKFNSYKEAWEMTYFEVSELLKKGSLTKDKNNPIIRVKNLNPNFIEEIGGIDVITRVHKKFYDDIFEEPWLGKFFDGKDKKSLVKRQTEFMLMSFGGNSEYHGETPSLAHMHMYLTEEMILTREILLKNAILSEGISEEICNKWIEVDHFFGVGLIKKSINECVLKCFGQAPIIAEKPLNYINKFTL